MAFSILSSIKTKLSPVLTTETQNTSLLGGLLGGSLSGIIGSITGSTPSTSFPGFSLKQPAFWQ